SIEPDGVCVERIDDRQTIFTACRIQTLRKRPLVRICRPDDRLTFPDRAYYAIKTPIAPTGSSGRIHVRQRKTE
ncbi:MAG TPA: hypothetical protein QF901_02680, partial [Gammaproteobacteria bacterium]|nr:hypothetical protein [Gammaproteobacteria bacterium]